MVNERQLPWCRCYASPRPSSYWLVPAPKRPRRRTRPASVDAAIVAQAAHARPGPTRNGHGRPDGADREAATRRTEPSVVQWPPQPRPSAFAGPTRRCAAGPYPARSTASFASGAPQGPDVAAPTHAPETPTPLNTDGPAEARPSEQSDSATNARRHHPDRHRCRQTSHPPDRSPR